MALFAVIALKESGPAVDEVVETLDQTNRYKMESGKWVVQSGLTTAREVSQSLGLRDSQPHVVFAIRGYSGRAQPDLWEWLTAKSV
jgi:hypothetical protein